jgi:hypothetical protein
MNKAGAFLPRSQHLSASAHEQRSGSSPRRTSSSSLLCLVRCVMSIFVFAWALQCLTACAYQPLCKARLRPHPNFALTSLLFRSAIFFFSSTKFGTCFGLVYCSQASLQHLQPHIFLEEPSAYKDLGYYTIVLVASVYVCAYSAGVDQIDEPFMGLLRERLSFSAPVCKFWCVDSSNPDVKLGIKSAIHWVQYFHHNA